MRIRTTSWLPALLASGLAAGAMPDAARFVDEVEAGRLDPAAFDFAREGFWQLDAQQRQSWQWALLLHASNAGAGADGPPPASFDPTGSCDAGAQRRLAAMAWALPAVQAEDEEHWRVVRAELLANVADLDEMLDEAAQKVDVAALPPRLAELQRRFARDQAIRDPIADQSMAAVLSPLAGKSWFLVRVTRWVAVDCDNTRWLKEQLAAIGWFDRREHGAAADNAAWHLVQHADRDVQFQRATLAKLQSLPPGATDQQRLASLYDRVALAEGRPQRYGTQRSCLPDGGSRLRELEEPSQVNRRRAEVGLEPIDTAPQMKTADCPQPAD